MAGQLSLAWHFSLAAVAVVAQQKQRDGELVFHAKRVGVEVESSGEKEAMDSRTVRGCCNACGWAAEHAAHALCAVGVLLLDRLRPPLHCNTRSS